MNKFHESYDSPPLTEVEELKLEIKRLNLKIVKLEKASSTASWRTSPDRMGGSFTEWEIKNASAWR